MPQAPRHAPHLRYFQGELPANLFSQAVLLGPTGSTKVEMLSYMALYADGDFPYVTLVPGRLTPSSTQAASQLRDLRFPEETAQAESRGRRATVAGSPEDVDETIWQLGCAQVDAYGLPVIFVTWMRIMANNQRKVMLWYASMTQGRWALARFKRGLERRR